MLYELPPEELGDALGDEPGYRAGQLRHWLYRDPVLETAAMTNLPSSLRDGLAPRLWPFAVELAQEGDGGLTRKWLFRAPDGASVESVLMGYPDRITVCVSSQAGCAMACSFCATGQFGFERHLTAGEIVAQVAYAKAALKAAPMANCPRRVTNVVFMGMGEPLANYPRVAESLRRLIDVMDMAARAVTVSTVGVVPGMEQLADSPWQVGLAVSLHGADDATRSRLVPLNDRYPLDAVIAACRRYFEKKGRRVTLEWTLMHGTNDSPDQARRLAAIATDLGAHVNVINLNPTPLTAELPAPPAAVRGFMEALTAAGANATLRATRGQDIDGGCGQLRSRATTTPVTIQGTGPVDPRRAGHLPRYGLPI